MSDEGYRADTRAVETLTGGIEDMLAELRERRRGDAYAIGVLESLFASLAEFEPAPMLRSRLRAKLPTIIEALQPEGPIALALAHHQEENHYA